TKGNYAWRKGSDRWHAFLWEFFRHGNSNLPDNAIFDSTRKGKKIRRGHVAFRFLAAVQEVGDLLAARSLNRFLGDVVLEAIPRQLRGNAPDGGLFLGDGAIERR